MANAIGPDACSAALATSSEVSSSASSDKAVMAQSLSAWRTAARACSPPGDERGAGARGQHGRRGVHAVAAQRGHPGLACGQHHVVDRQVADHQDQPAGACLTHSGGISR
jgi:hypothetical protein